MVFAIKTSSWPLNGASRETGCKGLSQGAQKAESCERKPANDAHWRDMDKNRVSGLKRQHRWSGRRWSREAKRGFARDGWVMCAAMASAMCVKRLVSRQRSRSVSFSVG